MRTIPVESKKNGRFLIKALNGCYTAKVSFKTVKLLCAILQKTRPKAKQL